MSYIYKMKYTINYKWYTHALIFYSHAFEVWRMLHYEMIWLQDISCNLHVRTSHVIYLFNWNCFIWSFFFLLHFVVVKYNQQRLMRWYSFLINTGKDLYIFFFRYFNNIYSFCLQEQIITSNMYKHKCLIVTILPESDKRSAHLQVYFTLYYCNLLMKGGVNDAV